MREYLLVHNQNGNHNLIGVFTNRKKVFEAIEQIEIKDCYIKGVRKNIPLNIASFGANITDKIIIYRNNDNQEEIAYKVLEIRPNLFNPYLKNQYPNIDKKYFG